MGGGGGNQTPHGTTAFLPPNLFSAIRVTNMLYPFILGILTKLYDDSVDINQFPESTPYLQSLIILFFALSAQNQFFFVVPCILVTALNNGFDNPFWKSIFPVSILMSIIYFPLGERMILLKIALAILAVLALLVLAYLEELYFPEEISKRKVIFRSILSAVLITMLAVFPTIAPFLLPRFSIEPIEIATYIQLGFVLTSVITMSYRLLHADTLDKKASA
jgi:multidrug transporter EmrE-like cation transporter